MDESVLQAYSPVLLSAFKYAPVTTVDNERSLSLYKFCIPTNVG